MIFTTVGKIQKTAGQIDLQTVFVQKHTLENTWQNDCNSG